RAARRARGRPRRLNKESIMTVTRDQYSVVGKSLPRVDAVDRVTGRSIYAADYNLPGQLHARLLRSPHAHARILSIDTSAAEQLPGAPHAATGETLKGFNAALSPRSATPLAAGKVNFHSQPVAAVVAETPHIAEDALELIKVEYEPLPVVLEPEDAMREDAPSVRVVEKVDEAAEAEKAAHGAAAGAHGEAEQPKSPNLLDEAHFTRGDLEQGFREADVVIEHTYR